MINSKSGFSLIEIMVGIALLGALSVGVTHLIQNMNKGNVKSQSDSDILLATNEITSILSDPANCKATIPKTDTKPVSVFYKTSEKFKVNQPFGNINSIITDYEFVYPAGSSTEAILNITYKRKEILAGADLKRRVVIYIEVAGNNVIHCRSIISSTELWTRGTGVNSSDIFFAGKVGIGTAGPVGNLHIANDDASNLDHTTIVDSKSQASLLLRGFSDSGKTYSALFFGKDNLASTQNSWMIAHQNDIEPKGGFAIGKWKDCTFHNVLDISNVNNYRIGLGGMDEPEAPLHLLANTISAPFSAIVDSTSAQASLLIRGKAIGTAYSTLYLGKMGTTSAADAWSISYSKIQPADGMLIGKQGEVPAIAISSDSTKLGIGTGDPLERLHVEGKLLVTDRAKILGKVNLQDGLEVLGITKLENLELTGDFTSVNFQSSGLVTANKIVASDKIIASSLQVDGQAVANSLQINGPINASGVISSSDRRLKKDIHPLENSLEKILKLNPVGFEWINKNFGKGKQIGFIAQEMEEIFPELVSTDSNGYKAIAYQSLISPLVSAIQDQEKEIVALKNELKEMHATLCEMNPKLRFCR
ncbi:MAG: tail fiber domain-containing protein [Bdellovibrionales bacterium]|nr:tail fiber domain-containing protein [Bdellovibrionales bacterium]